MTSFQIHVSHQKLFQFFYFFCLSLWRHLSNIVLLFGVYFFFTITIYDDKEKPNVTQLYTDFVETNFLYIYRRLPFITATATKKYIMRKRTIHEQDILCHILKYYCCCSVTIPFIFFYSSLFILLYSFNFFYIYFQFHLAK